jgi:prephenate dehydratase
LEATLSTSAAVEELASHPGAAAIASARAAEIFGVTLLARAIQDRKNNATRFVAIGRHDSPRTGHDKTSLAFKTAHDRPGTLLEVLSEFASRGINLTKIESRPSKDALGVYVFLLDFEGHQSDPIAAEALARVDEKTSWLRLLGSYPCAETPA